MASPETTSGEKMNELQKQINSVMSRINNNSKVVAFMNSPVGQYLDERPFLSLSLLVFIALSAVPVGLFLTVIAGTAVTACLGVIILEDCYPGPQTRLILALKLETHQQTGKFQRTELTLTRRFVTTAIVAFCLPQCLQ
ncbi:lipid droplet assembly factor 1 isoform X2 [Phyllobates terribilis]|uniref:lipid droplet assembly factor 1 isoform X2 n=1 Tax=Phyllobates terribilis TaxID=111132 RepID=UPI003CCB31D3